MKFDQVWWKNGVIYQIYPRSFKDSNHDGIGDLKGIIQKLDYLADLGIDAIWLSPIYPSPDVDFGYDVSNYIDVDPRYGTLEEFDTLFEGAHHRNIKIILDLVLNHTSDQHPWFNESRKSRDNPYHDWYIWHDPAPAGGPPNNWLSCFGGDSWEFDEALGQYYFHMFYKEQPDLNWRNPEVRKAMLDVYRFWLDRGVDGFRMDVFNMYFKEKDLQDNPLGGKGLRKFDHQRHLYDMSQPEMYPLLQEIRQMLDSYGATYMVGETFLSSPQQAAQYIGPDKLHAGFDFGLLSSKFSAQNFRKAINEWIVPLEGKWPNFVLNNHDTSRSATRFHSRKDDTQLKVSATMLLTLVGTPFIYYGEEIGMRDIFLWRHQVLDPVSRRYWPLHPPRDGCRSPMQWDNSTYAGFSEQKPWLPVHPDHRNRNVKAQSSSPGSLLNFYKKLLVLRRTYSALSAGSMEMIDHDNLKVLSYLRQSDDETILVCLNMTCQPASVEIPSHLTGQKWTVLLSQHLEDKEITTGVTLSLKSYETLVLVKKIKL
jgi:alpha-glucosidase